MLVDSGAQLGNRLLRGLHRGYDELMTELRAAGEGPAVGISPGDGWSARDYAAHLAAWEALEVARAEGRTGVPEQLEIFWEATWRRW